MLSHHPTVDVRELDDSLASAAGGGGEQEQTDKDAWLRKLTYTQVKRNFPMLGSRRAMDSGSSALSGRSALTVLPAGVRVAGSAGRQ